MWHGFWFICSLDPIHPPHPTSIMQNPLSLSTRMPLLFARYIAGQITDQTWGAFTDVIDSLEASLEERTALAAFFSDAIEDLGLDVIKLPQQKDAEAMVVALRTA